MTTQTHTALLTGASSGIGLEMARVAAGMGHNLVLVARREDRLEALAAELREAHGVTASVFAADLAPADAAAQLHQRVTAAGLSVDILVNNAGFGLMGNFADQDLDRLESMIDLNVRALTSLTHRFLPGMLSAGWGRVLNVASVASFQPGPGSATYHATKAYVRFFSEALDHELRGTGVAVSTLCPGITESEFHDVAHVQRSAAFQRAIADTHTVARLGYEAALKGKRVVVPGTLNKLLAIGSTKLPSRLVTTMSANVLSKGHLRRGEQS